MTTWRQAWHELAETVDREVSAVHARLRTASDVARLPRAGYAVGADDRVPRTGRDLEATIRSLEVALTARGGLTDLGPDPDPVPPVVLARRYARAHAAVRRLVAGDPDLAGWAATLARRERGRLTGERPGATVPAPPPPPAPRRTEADAGARNDRPRGCEDPDEECGGGTAAPALTPTCPG